MGRSSRVSDNNWVQGTFWHLPHQGTTFGHQDQTCRVRLNYWGLGNWEKEQIVGKSKGEVVRALNLTKGKLQPHTRDLTSVYVARNLMCSGGVDSKAGQKHLLQTSSSTAFSTTVTRLAKS